MRKIKILLIMPELYYGGAETQFRRFIENIDNSKYELYVLIEHSFCVENRDLEYKYVTEHKNVKFLLLSRLSTEGNTISRYISYIRANRIIYKKTRELNPDISLIYSRIGLKSAFAIARCDVPIIYSERNVWNNPSKFWRQNGRYLKKCDIITCNSIDAKNLIESNNLNAIYIPNGIDSRDPLLSVPSNFFRIIVPAKIAVVKNQEIVIKALSYLDRKVQLTFIGAIEDEEYYSSLKELCSNLKLSDRVVFKGFCSNVIEIYKDADLIILPSRIEGLSNVILESYMYKRELLLSNISQNVKAGHSKQEYFDPDNEKELAEKINKIRSMSDVERDRILEEKREYVLANYSVANMVSSYEDIIYKETINTIIKESNYEA